MDNNVSLQIKRLIELDKRAIELESRKEDELDQLNQANRLEMERIEAQLQASKEEAKRTYEKLVLQAQQETEAIKEATNRKLQEIENTLKHETDAIASEWWKKIMKDLK